MRTLAIIVVLFTSLAAVGQTPYSTRESVGFDWPETDFDVHCSVFVTHEENVQCVNEMTADLQAAVNCCNMISAVLMSGYRLENIVGVPLSPVVIKFVEEKRWNSDTITMTVYETENNTEVYHASGSRLLINNDVTRLLTGYADYLKAAYLKRQRQAQVKARRETENKQ